MVAAVSVHGFGDGCAMVSVGFKLVSQRFRIPAFAMVARRFRMASETMPAAASFGARSM
jgi:hypothetical protein